jgi:mannose-6-phosphate isomerase
MTHVAKPWGHEEIWAATSSYVGKTLHISKGHRLSLQFHKKKEETIRVISGDLLLVTGMGPDTVTRLMHPGEDAHIAPGTIHRFCAPDSDVVLVEVSTPEIHDVVRLEDDYDR